MQGVSEWLRKSRGAGDFPNKASLRRKGPHHSLSAKAALGHGCGLCFWEFFFFFCSFFWFSTMTAYFKNIKALRLKNDQLFTEQRPRFFFFQGQICFFFNAATFSCINTGYIKMISSESYTTMKNLVSIFGALLGGQWASKNSDIFL